MFIVMVALRKECDEAEYTGIWYNSASAAAVELKRAERDPEVEFAWIEER